MKRIVVAVSALFIFLLLAASASAAVEATLYDETFIKSADSPVTVSKTFPALGGKAVIQVLNGSFLGVRVPSGGGATSIKLNGAQIFNSCDLGGLNSIAGRLRRTVQLRAGVNTLTVTLNDKTGARSRITLLQQIDAYAAAVVGPAGGTVTTASTPGATVVIPEGALSQPAIIAIRDTGEEGVAGHAYRFYSTVQPFLKPVSVSLNYDLSQLPTNIDEHDLTLFTGENYAVMLRDAHVDPVSHSVIGATTELSTYVIGAYQKTGVMLSRFSPAEGFRMPVGDGRSMGTLSTCGAIDSTEDLGANLSLADIQFYANGYPKITFNGSARGNRWIVGAAFNRDQYLTDYANGVLAPYGAYNPGEDWYMWGRDAAGSPVHAVADGIVVFNQRQWAESSSNPDKSVGLGKIVVVAHRLESGETVASVYGHLKNTSPCGAGTSVRKGDVLGLIDGTGAGGHLHFELAKGYQPQSAAQESVEHLLRVDPQTGEIKVPVRIMKREGQVTREDGWYWPGLDSAFIQKNYYDPSSFITSFVPPTPPPPPDPPTPPDPPNPPTPPDEPTPPDPPAPPDQPAVLPSPIVAMSPEAGLPGTTFSISGTGFTPNGSATLLCRDQSGAGLPALNLMTDTSGHMQGAYLSPADQPVGVYTCRAADGATGTMSNEVRYEIKPVIEPDVEVLYDLANLGGGVWQYSYTVRNNRIADPNGGLSWFTIYFPANTDASGRFLYTQIAASGSMPYNWRSQVLQPSFEGWRVTEPRGMYGCSADATLVQQSGGGVYRLLTPIVPGNSLNGFSVTFMYAGSGTPGPQEIRVFDMESGDVIWSGMTRSRTP